jgi:hypothetical protein
MTKVRACGGEIQWIDVPIMFLRSQGRCRHCGGFSALTESQPSPEVVIDENDNRISSACCNLSENFRLRTLASEQRARQASDPVIKNNWADLAIERHLPANSIAEANGQAPHIEFA